MPAQSRSYFNFLSFYWTSGNNMPVKTGEGSPVATEIVSTHSLTGKRDNATQTDSVLDKSKQTGYQPQKAGLSKGQKMAIAAAVGAVLLAPMAVLAAPVALSAVGFSSTGVVGGSIAAGVQSMIGNVAAGSTFALLQSAGAAGIGTGATAVIGATGAAAGAAVGAGGVVAFSGKGESTAGGPEERGQNQQETEERLEKKDGKKYENGNNQKEAEENEKSTQTDNIDE